MNENVFNLFRTINEYLQHRTGVTNIVQRNNLDSKDQTALMDLFSIKIKCYKFHKIHNKDRYNLIASELQNAVGMLFHVHGIALEEEVGTELEAASFLCDFVEL